LRNQRLNSGIDEGKDLRVSNRESSLGETDESKIALGYRRLESRGLAELAADSSNAMLSRYVKGVFVSKFDLSFGPKPISRYPVDFITDGQANQLAMQSMLQLNSSKGKTVSIVLTLEDIEAIGFGTLGNLPTLGHFSFIVFFDIKSPKIISQRIDKVLAFLADLNTKLADCANPDDSFAEEVFNNTCGMFDREFKQQQAHSGERPLSHADLIMKIVDAMEPVIKTDLKTIKALDAPLAHSLTMLLNGINEVATSLNLSNSSSSLRNLLLQVNRNEKTENAKE
jgi:hypothetical protein